MCTFPTLNSVPGTEQVPKCFLVLLQDPTHVSSASRALSLLCSSPYIPPTKRMRNAVILPFHGSRFSEQLASDVAGALCYRPVVPRVGLGTRGR